MSLLFLAIVPQDGKFGFRCFQLFVTQNYLGILAGIFLIAGRMVAPADDLTTAAGILLLTWSAMVLYALTQHTIWMIALLFRNPPTSTA